jgi:hypothetical protein
MWTKRDVVRAGSAIIVTLAGWVIIRLVFPFLDYYPPESLVRDLGPSRIANAGMRQPVKVGYVTVALVFMALFFKVVQERWPGRGAVKGLAFGVWFGVVWSLGFLTGWAFLGTTLRAELLNGVVDLIPLAVAGWLIGVAIGRDVPTSEQRTTKPWLAALFVAFGFVAVHTLGATFLADVVDPASRLLLVPASPLQFALLAGLGVWVGGMFVVLRAGLPFESTWARAAFFAFGVFGYCWTWFHLFFVIEFAGVLPAVLLVGLTGAVGVFAGARAYEWLARVMPRRSTLDAT